MNKQIKESDKNKVIKRVKESCRLHNVSIPKSFLDKIGVKKDEYVNVELKGKKIIITKQIEEEKQWKNAKRATKLLLH